MYCVRAFECVFDGGRICCFGVSILLLLAGGGGGGEKWIVREGG